MLKEGERTVVTFLSFFLPLLLLLSFTINSSAYPDQFSSDAFSTKRTEVILLALLPPATLMFLSAEFL